MQEQKTTISLQQELPPADMNALYLIDWEKVTSVNDLMVIIASLGISFSPHHPAWDRIKGLVDYNNPVVPQSKQVPESKEIKLPKIKQI
jgi:hypothetical protein